MTHKLSNASARAAAKTKLLTALGQAQMIMGILPLWSAEFAPFKAEVKKANISWMSDTDLDELIYLSYLNLPGRPKVNEGLLSQSLTSEMLEVLAETVVTELHAPRDYWFYFPLPQIIVTEAIPLSPSVEIVPNINENQPGLFGSVPAKGGGSLLKVHGSGYVFNGRNQSAFVDAMRKLKWALQIATLLGFLTRTSKKSSPYVLALTGTEQQDIHHAKWTTVNSIHNSDCLVRLSAAFSRYLSELTFTLGEWNKTTSSSLQQHVGRLLVAVQDPIAQLNVGSIRRSLEWAFDGSIDEDEHMSFIKICIGLEAAIAEQSEEIGITEQLADRCAFLLDKTSTARAETRALMKKIYQLRSKLVHGAAAGLSGPERELARQAEKTLQAVLHTELNAVLGWYADLAR